MENEKTVVIERVAEGVSRRQLLGPNCCSPDCEARTTRSYYHEESLREPRVISNTLVLNRVARALLIHSSDR